MFGTSDQNSDYDFTIVVVDEYKGEMKIEKEGIDCSIFKKSKFIEMVEEENDIELSISLFIPTQFIWLQKWKPYFVPSFQKIEKTTLTACTSFLF